MLVKMLLVVQELGGLEVQEVTGVEPEDFTRPVQIQI